VFAAIKFDDFLFAAVQEFGDRFDRFGFAGAGGPK
jgi:hypothetical protein